MTASHRIAVTVAIVVAMAGLAAHGQGGRQAAPGVATPRRVALVVGNDAYVAPARPLANAANDARGLASTLRGVGFSVTEAINLRRAQFDQEVNNFVTSLKDGDVALFFYAGHGLQVDGENYLIPIDFAARDGIEAKYQGYSANLIHDRISGRGVRLAIVILDACRNNPYATARRLSEGLAIMASGKGSYIAYATGPGQTAADNPVGSNGLFTGALIEALRQPGLGLDAVFARVRDRVAAASGNRQVPWTSSNVVGGFVFNAAPAPAATAPAPVAGPTAQGDLNGSGPSRPPSGPTTSRGLPYTNAADCDVPAELRSALESARDKIPVEVTSIGGRQFGTQYAGTMSGLYARGGPVFARWGFWGLKEHIVGSSVAEWNDSNVVVGTSGGVFQSVDRGKTWTRVLFVRETYGCPLVAGGAPPLGLAAVCWNQDSASYFESLDWGRTWSRKAQEPLLRNATCLSLSASRTPWIVSPAGDWTSPDGGKTWRRR